MRAALLCASLGLMSTISVAAPNHDAMDGLRPDSAHRELTGGPTDRPPAMFVHVPKAGGYSLFGTIEQHAAELGRGGARLCNHHGEEWDRKWFEASAQSCWLHASEAPYPTKLFNESPKSRVRCSSQRCSPVTKHHNVRLPTNRCWFVAHHLPPLQPP